jgi:hypothetical protein
MSDQKISSLAAKQDVPAFPADEQIDAVATVLST